MTKARTPRFYFSLRSPYSWLAYRRLLAEYPDIAELVEWVPFWEPDERSAAALTGTFPYSAMSRAKHLYILQDVSRLARQAAVPLAWPVDRAPVWEIPHLAYLVAERAGLGREYVAATYRTRWEQGRDICDRAIVAEIAASIGVDPDAAASAADDPDLRADGCAILERICRDGVFGVPFFVNGFNRYWGVERLADFAAELRARLVPATGLPAIRAGTVGLGRSSDEGHVGGCG
ncbi:MULTISPECIES: 2-hydroxychromene-2-carboxylate isomerase [Protofrankia]|uniref:2-hydroxychromene-2-carboxylate isomerase n=1 Tax=Protofrankia coriariae TaxID=1562887 RepID=A0ABR5F649_9ACTN|nr:MULTISPECIES: DsbA family protein [Protofrankia]KLL12206.1 isomerase [Protofrankia coriariae]ONH37567.1 isomerase [Protofrankia sp. BMG5.30]